MNVIEFDQKAPFGSGYGLVPDLTLSAVIWCTLFAVIYYGPDSETVANLSKGTYLDLKNRMTSFIHGVLILVLSAYQVYFAFTECGDATNGTEYLILVISGGYFTYDFLLMAVLGLLDLDMAIHHCLCVGGICTVLLQNMGAGFVVQGLFVAEVSNPAMHMRIMLRHLGLRYTQAYEMAEYTYFTSFFFGRMIIGHPVVYSTVTCPSVSKFAQFVSIGILLQSYMFLYRMYFILQSRIREVTERKTKGIKNHWFTPIPQKVLEDCAFWQKSQKVKEKLP